MAIKDAGKEPTQDEIYAAYLDLSCQIKLDIGPFIFDHCFEYRSNLACGIDRRHTRETCKSIEKCGVHNKSLGLRIYHNE